MEMKIIPANGGGPGMDGVFLSGYGDGDYTPRPRSGPLPSLSVMEVTSFNSEKEAKDCGLFFFRFILVHYSYT